jgi:hypothetical protein
VEVPGESMTWREISEAIGDTLYSVGRVDLPGAISVPYETETGMDNGVLSNCARSRADRLGSLGWKAEERSLRETIRGDVLDVLETM